MAPFVHPSLPPSTSWKACSHTREPPADLQSPLRLGVAEKSGSTDACLKNHDAELAPGQFVDECRGFVRPRDFAHRRSQDRRPSHAADELGQFRAQARLQKADAGTIRKLHGSNVGENAVHGSDSLDNAKIEIAYFFPANEVAPTAG